MDETETAASDHASGDEGEKDESAKGSPPEPRPGAGRAVSLPWLDRWWVWALAGLALAALIGLLDLTSSGN